MAAIMMDTETLTAPKAPNQTRMSVHGWPALLKLSKTLLIFVGCFFIALTSGINNAFNPIASDIQISEHLSLQQMSTLVAFSLVGTFFTVPAGYLNDTFGPFRTCLIGTTMTGLGYAGMSFLGNSTYPLMVILVCLTGFGGGFSFTAALATSLKVLRLQPGIAVFIVGGGMSLSMAFASLAIQIMKGVTGCDDHSCWRSHTRLLATLVVFIQLPSSLFALRLYETSAEFKPWVEPSAADHGHHSDDEYGDIIMDRAPQLDTQIHEKLSLLQSWVIVKNYFAWVVGISYTVGIGSGLLVISQLVGLITSFGGSSSWIFAVSMSFSVGNAVVGGGLSGFLGDYIPNRFRSIRRSQVYGGTMLVSSLVFFVLGTVSSEPTPHSAASQVVFNLFLIIVGIFFGTNFIYAPSIIAETFGGINFGVFFGYVQLLTAAATFAVPAIAGVNLEQAGNCVATFFGFQYLLSFCGLMLLFISPCPLTLNYDKV